MNTANLIIVIIPLAILLVYFFLIFPLIDSKIIQRCILVVLAVVTLSAIIFRSHINYFLFGNDRIVPGECDVTISDGYETESVYLDECFDYDTEVYRIPLDSKWFNDPNTYIYLHGKYWNYPFSPRVSLNNYRLSTVTSERASGGSSSKIFCTRTFYCDINGIIIPNKIYNIIISYGNVLKGIKLYFYQNE